MTALEIAPSAAPQNNEEPIRLAVADRQEIADGVISLTLITADDDALPAWAPGSHVELDLGDGVVRQYSLCGRTDSSSWRIAVLNEPAGRGGSALVHNTLSAGSTVVAHGPRNHFRLEPATRYRFVAGGIGITPILAMIQAAEAAGAQWELLYGGRTRSSMAFLDELTPYGERVSVRPEDEFGLLDLMAFIGDPTDDTLVYACGPEPLLVAIENTMADWADALHLERFAPKQREDTTEMDQAFEVECTSSGLTVTVAADQNILDAVEAAGVPVVSSCGEGTCGTCETPIISGQADHRDSVLSPSEQASNTCMMICVSRALGPRLVLDL